MSILLTHAYFLEEDSKEQLIMKPYPPLGILYLSAWLEQHELAHEVFDTTFSNRAALKTYLLDYQPEIIAFYANLMTRVNLVQLLDFILSEPLLENSLIVLGGPDVTYNAQEYLDAGADVLVIGEGEQTLLELARWRAGKSVPAFRKRPCDSRKVGSDLSGISGIAYLLEDGTLFKTNAREKLKSLDELPFPNRKRIDLGLYLDAWKAKHGSNAISISTQRGCPYTCKWCSTAVYGQSYRRRSPANVVDEIVALQANYAFDLIWFVDDVFTVSHKWIEAFSTELAHRQIRIRYECITRADRLNESVLKTMRDSGCFRVWIGAESGSQRIIDAMDRRVEVKQVQEMIQAAKRFGMETGTFIMLGYPGETEEDIRATLQHLKASDPDWFTITVAYPIKGTALYDSVKAQLQAPAAWNRISDRELDFERTYPRAYYDYAVRWTVNAVMWHKSRKAGTRQFRYFLKAVLAYFGMKWSRLTG